MQTILLDCDCNHEKNIYLNAFDGKYYCHLSGIKIGFEIDQEAVLKKKNSPKARFV